MSFASIRYLEDNIKVIVPVGYIKNYDGSKKILPSQMFKVFYSKFIHNCNKLNEIEKLPAKIEDLQCPDMYQVSNCFIILYLS